MPNGTRTIADNKYLRENQANEGFNNYTYIFVTINAL